MIITPSSLWPQAAGHEKLGNENDTYVHSDKKWDDQNDGKESFCQQAWSLIKIDGEA